MIARYRNFFAAPLFVVMLLAASAHAGSHTWGGATSGAWSLAGNWSSGGAPTAIEANVTLIFPAGASNQATNNDIPGLTIASITFAGSGYSITGQKITLSGGISSTGTPGSSVGIDLDISVFQTFTVNTGTLTISSVISSTNSVGFTKDGIGTLIISGTCTYPGLTTVSDGVLTVNGSISSSKVNLTGGTLNGSGSIGGLSADGTVSPGNNGPSAMASSGNTAFNSASTFVVELNGTAPGTGYDQINVTGQVTAGGTLAATLGFASANADAFTIVNNDGQDAVGGQFNGLVEGATLTIGTEDFTLSYKGGSGNDIVLTHVVKIRGTVVDKDGNPFAGVVITDGTRTGTSAPDGTYEIDGVPNGAYNVTPALTGRLFSPANTAVTIAGSSKTGVNFQLLGTPLDIDGDGFSDLIETAAGTSITDPSSTPFSGKLAPAAEPLQLSSLQIKLNFSIFIKKPSDALSFGGSLPVTTGFSPTGQQVITDCGGVIRVFNLSDKGISPKGDDSFKLSKAGKDGTAKFALKMAKGTFVDTFKDELLRGTIDAKNELRQVQVTVYFTDRIFTKLADVTWTAKKFKNGSAKLKTK